MALPHHASAAEAARGSAAALAARAAPALTGEELLQSIRGASLVMVTFGNAAFTDYVLNWVAHVARLGVPYVIGGAPPCSCLPRGWAGAAAPPPLGTHVRRVKQARADVCLCVRVQRWTRGWLRIAPRGACHTSPLPTGPAREPAAGRREGGRGRGGAKNISEPPPSAAATCRCMQALLHRCLGVPASCMFQPRVPAWRSLPAFRWSPLLFFPPSFPPRRPPHFLPPSGSYATTCSRSGGLGPTRSRWR